MTSPNLTPKDLLAKRVPALGATLVVAVFLISVLAMAGEVSDAAEVSKKPERVDVNAAEITQMDEGARAEDDGARKALWSQPVTRAMAPMFLEIQAQFEAESQKLKNLYTAFAAARDHDEALRIQLEIELLKRNTEIRVLEIQLEYASLAGKTTVANELSQAIESLKNPPPAVVSQKRAVRRAPQH